MSELRTKMKETEWSEGDREDYSGTPEPTYRDGSVRNECWDPGTYGSRYHKSDPDDD